MAYCQQLPNPQLDARRFGARCLPVLTDQALYDAVGVRIAFTGREGGVSRAPFDSFNLGTHVHDDPAAVLTNRSRLLSAFEKPDMPLLVPNQVHGDVVVSVDDVSVSALEDVAKKAQMGSDALVVGVSEVGALLCFADCVPVIVVSPTGRFAVIHAGWRGVMNGIAVKTVRQMIAKDSASVGQIASSQYNVYIGPHIHASCFETSEDVRDRFVERFGDTCAPDSRHVSLLDALRIDLTKAGVRKDRIVDAGICSVCSHDTYFSYRASGGTCGRHGAFAYRERQGED